jgi:flagellar biosynthesis protein FlhG
MAKQKVAENGKKIWAIGGGKGGIGKTLFTANMGVGLAGMGKKVIVVDSDLGGANMHTLFGIKFVKYCLNDYINSTCTLEEAILPTSVKNLRLISGADGILGSANPSYFQKIKTIKCFNKLEADYILVDLGAGSSYNVLDFLNSADEKIIIFSPEPTSIQNAYGFLKSALYRKLIRTFKDNKPVQDTIKEAINPKNEKKVSTLDELSQRVCAVDKDGHIIFKETVHNYRPNTIINMLRNKGEQNIALSLNLTAKKFLNLDMNYIGFVESDDIVSESVKAMTPFMKMSPDAHVSNSINKIIQQLV